MAIVSAVSFSLFNFVGDPVNNMVGQDATREQRIEIRQQLGLDDPVLTQYSRFLGNMLQGDFGYSFEYDLPVTEVVGDRLFLTVIISVATILFTWMIAFPIGIYSATHQYSWGD